MAGRQTDWLNGGELEQFKAMDRFISRCEVRQYFQMQPGVRVREKRRSRCYPVFTFSYSSHRIFCALLVLGRGHLRVPVIHEDARRYLNL